jgi:hypothetical protein
VQLLQFIILDNWEAEVRRIMVKSQSRQKKICKIPISINDWEVLGSEFKSQYYHKKEFCKKKKNNTVKLKYLHTRKC